MRSPFSLGAHRPAAAQAVDEPQEPAGDVVLRLPNGPVAQECERKRPPEGEDEEHDDELQEPADQLPQSHRSIHLPFFKCPSSDSMRFPSQNASKKDILLARPNTPR